MDTAKEFANYIVAKCIDDKEYISNLQLQKILYLVQIAFYQKLDRPAFFDDIEAWNFGPVVQNVYYKWCGVGAMPIDIAPKMTLPSKLERAIIDPIVEKARAMKPWDLAEVVLRENGPWAKAYNAREECDVALPAYLKYPVISSNLFANAKIDWTVS